MRRKDENEKYTAERQQIVQSKSPLTVVGLVKEKENNVSCPNYGGPPGE
ncbi:hypothetical protein PTRG_00438 [Pyrenophora tritici-repentis Pt-1C-BFP]|uniref:Uncharacterized protein n=1 Tax=Pyrenophora tritici-repentis (strain Pt-1C-BFP) TaxID=426418 RepID=B2VR11_PYRTR|nr:uncharacterized protein PTRG_00438 [Pyrenophora tritici-repentis Pt-1C-BFP]EDU39876.1 hypothetical protein PTRG_00438 [Pyrenophora tritici-repentis Pt-1C-BFP]